METTVSEPRAGAAVSIGNRTRYAIYALALGLAFAVWFQVIRAPLFLDETGSYWHISAGLGQVWSRLHVNFPAYEFILALWVKIFGTSEMAMRTLSILAMSGAAYLLYRSARELFDRELSLMATLVFCVHPIVVFAAIFIRPYAFAVLATNAAIFTLLRMRKNDSNGMAALFGLLAALIVYFHNLFAAILPAFVVCFFVLKRGGDRKAVWRQFWVAAAVFVAAFLPTIPGVRLMFRTSTIHVSVPAPDFADVVWTFAPGFLPIVIGGAVLATMMMAAVTRRKPEQAEAGENWKLIVCLSLALIPLLILYGVSAGTPIHIFETRHRLVAVPGIALCWTLLMSYYLNRTTRLLFCAGVIVALGFQYFLGPNSQRNATTWKYAVEFLNQNAAKDNAPVVICSPFPESNYMAMPVGSAKTSQVFAPLFYYKLSVPVVPLPRALNDEAIRVGTQFLDDATAKHERFFAMADKPSYPTLDWLAKTAAGAYEVRNMGIFGGETEVMEFDPRVR